MREAAELVRDGVMLIWSRARRPATVPSAEYDEEHDPAFEDAPSPDTRADWFARELGDTWVEIEPGIYECSAQPPAESPLRLAGE